MKIERIDENTVKCFLSNEELKENHLEYQDFLTRTEKAKEVVARVMKCAEEEVGYKPPQNALDLQIMIMPEHGMVITLSEKDAGEGNMESLMECMKDLRKLVESGIPGKNRELNAEERQNLPEKAPEEVLLAFRNVSRVMEYAAVLPANLRVESSLYDKNGMILLHLKRGHASMERFCKAVGQSIEFAAPYAVREEDISKIIRFSTPLIAERALKALR